MLRSVVLQALLPSLLDAVVVRSIASDLAAPLNKHQQRLEHIREQQEARRKLYCDSYPAICALSCDTETPDLEEIEEWKKGNLSSGPGVLKANRKPWCNNFRFLHMNRHCILGEDLHAHVPEAHKIVEVEGAEKFFASYCFVSGHCANGNVTFGTKLDEAEQMCEAMYPHGKWLKTYPNMYQTLFDLPKGKVLDKKAAELRTKLTCAVGTYHCEVVQCQETFCKNETHRAKYAKYLSKPL